ncbi:MAG: ATP-binding protein [Acidobacteriota bacterium]|nr:ATP-binding protein [Acidobacteriota bacterium]
MSGASDSEAREFAQAFRSFLEWVHSDAAQRNRNEVVALVADFLGEDARRHSVVTRSLPVFEPVNLQTALLAWSVEPKREVEVRGITIPPHHGGVTLQQIVGNNGVHALSLSPPPLVDLPNGPGSTLACLNLGLLLVSDELGRYVVMVNGPGEHDPSLDLEIAGLAVDHAQAVHARLDSLRRELNVYRGHLLEVDTTPMGAIVLHFAAPSGLQREDVILPAEVLERVERHALGVAAHRDALLSSGQHLKRGLLLYGPPGTGKTHTTRYLVGQMPGYTRFVLTGRALRVIGPAAEMARELQPSALILEDVDLVAEERTHGPGSSPVLFDLLDAMDGAAGDADLLFLLTTNRADLLEPALAARPGRVDIAVQIKLPEAGARRALLELYGHSLDLRLSGAEIDDVVERTQGVTASFIKELLRRAVLESLIERDGQTGPVEPAHMRRALDDLMDASQEVTRSLLGVGDERENLPAGGGLGSLPPQGGGVWLSGRAAARLRSDR